MTQMQLINTDKKNISKTGREINPSLPVRSVSFVFSLLFFLPFFLHAQSSLYKPSDIKASYTKGIRSDDGSPGKNYWQNQGDYSLKIKFDPLSRSLEGTEVITYTNNSPDTLKQLVIRLYPDFYKKGGLRDISINWEDENDGVVIDNMVINDSLVDTTAKAGRITRNYTNLNVKCYRILPKQVSKISIKWHYTLNKGSHSRTGQVDEGAFFIAYCFPRIAVYDDTQGWDNSVFMGTNEPYFDWGNFLAEVTVPKGYVVWGTGVLQNAANVFPPSILKKYTASLTSDKVSFVIDSLDLVQNKFTADNAWNTFLFRADNVPDFSFALSNHYLWQAVSLVVDPQKKRRTVVNTAFNKTHHDFYEVNYFSKRTVELMSFEMPGVPYPYPHITVFDGLDQMEYPMMVNDNPLEDRSESIELTDHEIFHTFFPFYMGIDQTRFAWMDEGWATMGEWYITHRIDSTITDEYGMDRVKKYTGTSTDVPMIIQSTENKLSYYINSYPKPGLVYLYLRDMLGEKEFNKAVQYYMQQWNGKHPIPWDFFNCINKASGHNLDWFWQSWFYGWGEIDLGLKDPGQNGVTVVMKGSKPVPVYLEVIYTDGTKETLHRSAAVWEEKKEVYLAFSYKKEVKELHLQNVYVPERNITDNSWRK
jgi:hypothetical protein